MTDLPTRDRFYQFVNTPFQVVDETFAEITLSLFQVSELKKTRDQESFTILFHGPEERFMPQRIYRLRHEQLGEFDLFLVPIGKQAGSYQYEAVFNHLME